MFWRFHRLCGIQNPLEVFSDGEDVITWFKSNRAACALPALVFLDLKMPRMGGLDVLEYLSKSDHRGFSIVVLSGNEDSNLLAKAQQLGATSLLPKPVEKQQFCQLMDKIEGVKMEGCVDVPRLLIAPDKSFHGTGLHPLHREIFAGKDQWPPA